MVVKTIICTECGYPVTDTGTRQHNPLCVDCRPDGYDVNPLPETLTCWDCGTAKPVERFINGQNNYTVDRIREYHDNHPLLDNQFSCNDCQIRDYILERT